MKKIHLWPEDSGCCEGYTRLSFVLEIPGESRQTMWFSVPEEYATGLACNADPFLVASIYRVMEGNQDLHVHGSVSPSLLRNLESFQDAWAAWVPSLRRGTVTADTIEEPLYPQNKDGGLVAFSGGVDCSFTAYRHARGVGMAASYPLKAGLMVQGFDIPLDHRAEFMSATRSAAALLQDIGLDLIPMSTNYREIVTEWSHSFGAAISACMMLFAGRYSFGLLGQGLTYRECSLLHEGSNFMSDPLLSSDTFRIIPDGATYTRADKIRAMRDWDVLRKHLRVCWQGPRSDANCCHCEKCIRNILTFRALGLGLPECFASDVGDHELKTFRMGRGALPEIRYAGLADLASASGVSGPWLTILDKRLKERRRLQTSRLYRFTKRLPYYLRRLRQRSFWERLPELLRG